MTSEHKIPDSPDLDHAARRLATRLADINLRHSLGAEAQQRVASRLSPMAHIAAMAIGAAAFSDGP